MPKVLRISLVVPTYDRDQVLLKTIDNVMRLNTAPAEIIIVDQTAEHGADVQERLRDLDKSRSIHWIRSAFPSIPRAMNIGLVQARNDIVLFVDDDIVPCNNLITAHLNAYHDERVGLVAGRVIQPWDVDLPPQEDGAPFRFFSNKRQWITEFIGCNFSVRRSLAIELGGFDENFVHVAYRYEREFSERVIASGNKILFEPATTVHHLHTNRGGTRSYGNQLRTIRPSHAVGEYYFLLRSQYTRFKVLKLMWHPIRGIRTRHHLCNPWWIPVTLIAELSAFLWALLLTIKGPRYISETSIDKTTDAFAGKDASYKTK